MSPIFSSSLPQKQAYLRKYTEKSSLRNTAGNRKKKKPTIAKGLQTGTYKADNKLHLTYIYKHYYKQAFRLFLEMEQ